jgi:hypothetical protein
VDIDELLGRLSDVRKIGPQAWRARCPAHGGRSLQLKLENDGRILLWCWGCGGSEPPLRALGLTLAALFPEGPKDHHFAPVRRRTSALEVLDLARHECLVASMIITDGLERELTQKERDRLLSAAHRLLELHSESAR